MAQMGFYFDQSRCTGCAACTIACKDKHDLPVGVSWRRVVQYTTGTWREDADGTVSPSIATYYSSIACNHCDDAICVEVCPSTAMRKGDDGIVYVDPEVCIGCRYCEMACPYSAPQFNAELGVMTKCDLCRDRLAVGEKPACVASCPSRALDFGDVEELRAQYGAEAGIEPLPDPRITQPNLVIKPHPEAQPSGQGTGHIEKMTKVV